MPTTLTGEQLVNARIKSDRELPVIGLKEFEPSNTWLQNRQIQSALFERKSLLEEERVEKWGCLSTAVWRPVQGKAELTRKTGKHWDVFGHHKDNSDWLNPEEALFLMEMNCLEVLFEDVPMSIQRGYAVLISCQNGCSLNEYRVFLHLSRQGYRVFRHNPELTVTAYEKQIRLDKYVLDQKKSKEAPSQPVQESSDVVHVIDTVSIEDDSSDSANETTESVQQDDECIVINEVSNNVSIVQIDDSDDDIEVVFEKNVTQNSESDSESEEEEDSENDSICSGNWKRQSAKNNTLNVDADNKENVFKSVPSARVNYVTVNEFLYDVDLVRHSTRPNVDDELSKFYNEIEVIDIDSEPDEKPFIITQTKNDIMNSMQLLRDADGNIVVARPDERLLPPGVKPKYPLYRINLDALKSETQKRPYNPRPFRRFTNYRGRYNNNWNAWGGGNNTNTLMQLQTMAQSVMQVASVVFNSIRSTAPFQSNWQSRYQNQLRSIQPTSIYNTATSTPPLMQDYPHTRMPQTLNSFSNQNFYPRQHSSYESNYNTLGQNYNLGRHWNVGNYSSYSPRFSSTNHNDNRFGFNSHQQQTLPSLISNYRDTSVNNLSSSSLGLLNRQSDSYHRVATPPPNIKQESRTSDPAYVRKDIPPTTEDFISFNSRAKPQNNEKRDSYNRITTPPLNIKQESRTSDPAYFRKDIPPTSEDFISLNSRATQQTNRVNIVDVGRLQSNQDVVIVEDDIVNGFKRNGKRKANPNQRYFHLASKKYIKRRNQNRRRIRKQFKSRDDVEVIDIDDGIVVKQEKQVKQEQNDTLENNISQNVLLPTVKTEKRLQTSDKHPSCAKKIKTESDASNIRVKEEITIKKEQNSANEGLSFQEEVRVEGRRINASEIAKPNIDSTDIEVIQIKTEKPENKEETSIHEITNIKIENKEVGKEQEKLSETNVNPVDKDRSDADVEIMEIINNPSNNEIASNEVITTNSVDEIQTVDNEEVNKEIPLDNQNLVSASMENVNKKDKNESEMKNNEQETLEKQNESEECEVQENCGDNEIRSWTQLKENVSKFVCVERKEMQVEDEDENDVSPLLRPEDCKTVDTVLSALQIFKPPSSVIVEDKMKISFDIYLPTGTFRKSSRGVPAYRVVVIGRTDPVPSPGQIMELNKRFADNVTVILAVVMPDSVAYYSLSTVSLPVQQYNV